MSIEKEIEEVEQNSAVEHFTSYYVDAYHDRIAHILTCDGCSNAIIEHLETALKENHDKLTNEKKKAIGIAGSFLARFKFLRDAALRDEEITMSHAEIMAMGIIINSTQDAISELRIKQQLRKRLFPNTED